MRSPIITLTTDFGQRDHYVGTMKGVMLGICPTAVLVDISHDIAPFSILAGAYAIDQASPYFPSGTVHLVVVDPGVGTARKPLLVQASEQFFIAPDNGVLSLILTRDPQAAVYEIANPGMQLETISATFHGRDVFAPAAAALAASKFDPRDAGPRVFDPVLLAAMHPQLQEDGRWQGNVISVDRFGNVITNFPAADFTLEPGSRFTLKAGSAAVTLFRTAFGDAPAGVCFAYRGSSGMLEIAIDRENAAERIGLRAGDRLSLAIGS